MDSNLKHADRLKCNSSLAILATLLFATLLNFSPTLMADVYKWTDEKGNTHYSDIKPNELSSEKLNIKITNPQYERTSPQNTVQKLDANKEKELQKQAERLQSETQKKELEAQCKNIMENLKTLQENSRIKINENGKTRYLTPDEIDSKKKAYIEQINEQCQN